MRYVSTRDTKENKTYVTPSEAICRGLAPDGGLYVPETIPTLDEEDFRHISALDYVGRAAYVLSMFLDDFTEEELLTLCREAYSEENFPDGAEVTTTIKDGVFVLELWHGPTCAFKDMALQLMPRLFSAALKKIGETKTAHILVATSGDTGKAALEGYRGVPGVKITVFYPENGVSDIQKLQMTTQTGENVDVVAVKGGNFDDAQSGVKRIFADSAINRRLADAGVFLSSANSINWGRLAPQIVYYISAYCTLCGRGVIKYGDTLNVTVPTGNFGNILACFIAKKMGLPIGSLICASNQNHVLTDFLATGKYSKNREFYLTMSPSMDILISSNLERLLYFIAGADETCGYMSQLAGTGEYTVSSETYGAIRRDFVGYFANESVTAETIRQFYHEYGFLSDPHTAVALHVAQSFIGERGGEVPMLVCGTASPFKFAADVYSSITGCEKPDSISALGMLSELTGREIPLPLQRTLSAKVRFERSVSPDEMESIFSL
ncbi:MAG: threonine synthase [Clostridia bacterium]|nr:threonine synthase [Clostridia bacterium]